MKDQYVYPKPGVLVNRGGITDRDENSDTAITSLRGDNRPLRTMLDRLIIRAR